MSLSDSEIIHKFKILPTDKILDIGGSMKQHREINVHTLVDIIRPENAPYGPLKLLAKNFVQADLVREKLPFKDKEFDFCLCTHTLEDLSYPFLTIDEMSRVAKRGYIATPAFGKDIIFSHFNLTDWLTGARRVPGIGHHKWLFYKQGKLMCVVPKNYPLLYSSNFHFVEWRGEAEFEYSWEGKIEYKEFKDLNFHALISVYRNFVRGNKDRLKRGFVLFYWDNPFYYLKEGLKLLLRK